MNQITPAPSSDLLRLRWFLMRTAPGYEAPEDYNEPFQDELPDTEPAPERDTLGDWLELQDMDEEEGEGWEPDASQISDEELCRVR
jgi:hypothetical protein